MNRVATCGNDKAGSGGAGFQGKKSGLKVVTLIATLNPVSQVLW
jgi:hypothetical protein